MRKKKSNSEFNQTISPFQLFTLSLLALFTFGLFSACNYVEEKRNNLTQVRTISGLNREFGEPFGMAFDKNGILYVSDGEQGQVKRVSINGQVETVTDRLNTPSAI